MRSYGMTDIGQNRAVNQDSIFVSESSVGNLPNLYIVADGMGGHQAGDYASSNAVRLFVEEVKNLTYENPITIIGEAIQTVNTKLYQEASKMCELAGMGTTFVTCIIKGKTLYVANIGDSRLYITGDTIRQITRDHSLVEELVSMGKIDKKAAKTHEKKNMITRAVGVSNRVMADFFEVDLKRGEQIVLCSDGLSNMVEDCEILRKMNDDDAIEEKVKKLVALANHNGGKDNISVIGIDPEI